MTKNYWASSTKEVYARWRAYLPPPRGDIEPALRFAVAVANAAERESVWTPRRLEGRPSYERDTGGSLEEHLRGALARNGAVAFFATSTHPSRSSTPARLAYFEDGHIVEGDVDDMGALVRRLHPRATSLSNHTAAHVPPLCLEGDPLFTASEEPVYLDIRLETDIWFPRVVGWVEDWDDEGEDSDEDGPRDNSALAARHTPRLNRFLAEVHRAAEASGGHVELGEGYGFGDFYDPGQVTAVGILLPP